MIKKLGKVSTEESEVLNIMLEEAAEIVQATSKVFRFGWDSCHPDNPNWTNKEHLQEEIGDFICMIRILVSKGILDGEMIHYHSEKKLDKLKKFSDIDLKNIYME